MDDPALWHRLQFAFTVTYHYLFPQLTMGLAWFLVFWKWRALRTGDERYAAAARFWARIFGLNFAVGVVTGIPMEFQFGTNWSNFSTYSGGVIGQTLAMEGMFAFLLESAFVGALVWGEKRLGPRKHFLAAVAVAVAAGYRATSSWRRARSCSTPSATSSPQTARWRSAICARTCSIPGRWCNSRTTRRPHSSRARLS
jgi:cytochrome d ubiquinol oxidase subunit I